MQNRSGRTLGWHHVVVSCFALFNLTHFPMRAATDVANRHVILTFFEMSNVTGAVGLSLLVLLLFTCRQGLRAGDMCISVAATPHNCYLFCLRHGTLRAETLHHFVKECPLGALVSLPHDLHDYVLEPASWISLLASEKRAILLSVGRMWRSRMAWLRTEHCSRVSHRLRFGQKWWPAR